MASSVRHMIDFALAAWALGPTPADKAAIFWAETKNLRVRLGLARHHPEQTYSLLTRFGALHFRDNFGDITNLANIFYRRAYPVEGLTQPGAILDVGGNIGLASAWFQAHNPGRAITCFEPLPGNAALVRRNCPAAVVVQAAVGAAPGEARLQVDEFGSMASSLARDLATQELVFPVIPLDEYTQLNQIEEVALLKIDVEGMEEEVLAGATHTIERTHTLVLETHGAERHARIRQKLLAAGFQIKLDEFKGMTGTLLTERSHAKK